MAIIQSISPIFVLQFFLFTYSASTGKPVSYEDSLHDTCKTPGHFALTFDDGPAPGRTDAVLNVLNAYNVTATFFVCGQTYSDINQPDAQALILRVVNEGHQLGVHTRNHRYLSDPWRTADEIRGEIKYVHDKLFEITGQNVTIMRPPYGAYNETTLEIAKGEFGLDTILWNLNTLDWSHPGNTSAGIDNYVETTAGTSPDTHSFIALHHDPLEGGAQLAQAAIGFMKNLNYKFVTINECIHG